MLCTSKAFFYPLYPTEKRYNHLAIFLATPVKILTDISMVQSPI